MHPHTFTMLVHLNTLQKSFLDTSCRQRKKLKPDKKPLSSHTLQLIQVDCICGTFQNHRYSASLGRSILQLINCTWSLYRKHCAHAGFAQLSTLIQCIYLISHEVELLQQCKVHTLQVHTFLQFGWIYIVTPNVFNNEAEILMTFIVFSVKLMVRILPRWTSWPQTAIPENVVPWLFAVAVYIEKRVHYRPHHCKFTCSNHMDTYAHEYLHIRNFGTNGFIELVIPILIGCCSYTLHHCLYLT